MKEPGCETLGLVWKRVFSGRYVAATVREARLAKHPTITLSSSRKTVPRGNEKNR